MKPKRSLPSRTDQFIAPEIVVPEAPPVLSVFFTVAFFCWLGTIFILYSRFFDLALGGLYIPRITIAILLLTFIMSGRAVVFFGSSAGKLMVAFVVWIAITVFFSVWKGGSLPYFQQFLQSFAFFAVAASLPITISHVNRSLQALAFSGLLAALMSIPWGEDRGGRLVLMLGSYHDPNYYGMALLAVAPFFWAMGISSSSKLLKIVAWCSLLPVLAIFFKTGSRGALLGLACMLVLLLIISPFKTKVILVLVSAFGLTAVISTMPDYLRMRYLTVLSVDSVAAQPYESGNPELDRLHSDVDSSDERKRLLKESIDLTLEHPLVGVGPGGFQAAVYDEAREHGIQHNVWLMTHNSYTQISSETGFPGLLLLLCLIGAGFVNIRAVLKGAKPAGDKPDRAAYQVAKSLLLSLTVVSVCIFFLAIGYDFPAYVWVGLTVSLRRAYEQQGVAAAPAVNISEATVLAAPKTSVKPQFAPAIEPTRIEARKRLAARQTPATPGRSVRFNGFR